MTTPNFGNPVPGTTISAVLYDPEENMVVLFRGVLEVEDELYILRNPAVMTPFGPQVYLGTVVLGKVGDGLKEHPLESENEVRPNTAAPVQTAPVSSGAPSTFTALDRCDRCGARAYVRAVVALGDGEEMSLLFCGHHGKKHLPALREKANVTITDETERLYAEVSQDD